MEIEITWKTLLMMLLFIALFVAVLLGLRALLAKFGII